MIAWVLNTLKAVLMTLLQCFGSVLCCCSRSSNKNRGYQHESLTDVVTSNKHFQDLGGRAPELTHWDSWDENGGGGPSEVCIGGMRRPPPETVQDHIAKYRESLQAAREESLEAVEAAEAEPAEPDQDLFADMTPEVRKARKMYVGPKNPPPPPSGSVTVSRGVAAFVASGKARGQPHGSSRLMASELVADPLMALGDELADWDAVQSGGWAEAEDEEVSDVLREQRRQQKMLKEKLHRTNS